MGILSKLKTDEVQVKEATDLSDIVTWFGGQRESASL